MDDRGDDADDPADSARRPRSGWRMPMLKMTPPAGMTTRLAVIGSGILSA
jgi:hypothetical protein